MSIGQRIFKRVNRFSGIRTDSKYENTIQRIKTMKKTAISDGIKQKVK